ncbi:MAG: hypothetical protein WKG01_14220 [Kofleriaceae bacterium]
MTLEDAAAIASALPGVVVGTKWGNRTWMVGDRGFAWQRPFSKADLKRFGDDTPPAGDILAVRVENLDAKDALLEIAPPGFFTIPHFNGYAAVLVELRRARVRDVRAAIEGAWRTVTPVAKPKPKPKPAKRARRTRPSS